MAEERRATRLDPDPLHVHALPGERGGVVILMLEDWTSLHGSEGGEP